MTKIVVDEALRAKLRNLQEWIELCDSTGRTIALVQPIPATSQRELAPTFSDDAVEQSRRQSGGTPLAEIWERLRNQ
jgi:hypothetical protein